MPRSFRRLCVLTGGGDAPGLNSALYGLVTRAASHGIELVASRDGFDGLITGELHPLDESAVAGIASRGGSIIGCSNRANPFHYPVRSANGAIDTHDVSERVTSRLVEIGADALVALGGDGTLAICERLQRSFGVKCIGLPKTIDNDLRGTDMTFGFDSAVQCATWAIDRLHSTAASHRRVMIVEVMGRGAGWIAIESGLAGDAHVILIPEIPYDLKRVATRVRARVEGGATYSVIVVAEGARPIAGEASVRTQGPPGHLPQLGGAGERLRRELESELEFHEVRVTVLGHLQRGGPPSPVDRNLGLRFGVAAADLAARGIAGRLVALRNNSVVDVPLEEAIGGPRLLAPDGELCRTARALGVELGC